MKINKNVTYRKIRKGIHLLKKYISARIILLFHYDKKLFLGGKSFSGGKYGRFTGAGWSIVANDYFSCKRMLVNMDVPWPVSARIKILHPENIKFHPDDINNFQGFGNYYQAEGTISIGRGTYIAPNVGIITSNHSIDNLYSHEEPKAVIIGENCWIGMNSVILPGIILGRHTIVGAGSVVTKSFSDGECVIAGNPAKIIRKIGEDHINVTH